MAYPLPPLNVIVTSPFVQGILDLRWDNPALQAPNSDWVVLGVNVYRSLASDRGPYVRLNSYPVGGTFFRDYTNVVKVAKEIVSWESGWQARGTAPNVIRWTLKTRYPIAKPGTNGVPANSPMDVQVTVNGEPAWVVMVAGVTGEVTLESTIAVDPSNDRLSLAPIPTGPSDVVLVTYFTARNIVGSGVDNKSFYRVTTVAASTDVPGFYVETPLNVTQPSSDMQIEQLDYIWREAVRRNAWILDQGGENVKLFVMKVNGATCSCCEDGDPQGRELLKNPSNSCKVCFGTGFKGGYEGPYDVLMAPDDAEKRISQSQNGRRKEHSYEVWMGYTPIVSQRDFVVKQNNDRYSIGPVRRPTNRGNVIQQHFNIQYIDAGDIRYKFPIDGGLVSPNLPWDATRYPYSPPRETYDRRTGAPWPVTPDAVTPMASEKDDVPPEVQLRGRTGTFTNQNY